MTYELKTHTTYKNQTHTDIAIYVRRESNDVDSIWTLYSVRNAKGRVLSYGISYYRKYAVSPGDLSFTSKKAAFAHLNSISGATKVA